MRLFVTNSLKQPTVSIVYRFLPQWRVDFFDQLRDVLAARKIHLQLLYGRGTKSHPARHRLKWGNEVDLEWGRVVHNHIFAFGSYEIVWQSLPADLYDSDLIVFMQENAIVSNYWAECRARLAGKKIAFWGHGGNLQARGQWIDRLGDSVKKAASTRVDWWFAYTSSVARRVASMGYPPERITSVENAIDTEGLRAAFERLQSADLDRYKRELGLGKGPVGIFCGAMYQDKRLPFLFAACCQLREEIADFEMIFNGDGPQADQVQEFCDQHPWAHYVGRKSGLDRVPYFKLAKVFLMPGLVGLAILDSFALQTPMVTTDYRYHSPEIDYLENGVNGMQTGDTLEAFVHGAAKLLQDPSLRQRLIEGCRVTARRYTVANMASRFADGIEGALGVRSFSAAARQPAPVMRSNANNH